MRNHRFFPELKRLAAALQFLTIIPIPVKVSDDDTGGSLPWFPVAGLVTGLIAAAVFVFVHIAGFPPMMAGLAGVVALSGLNGFFHMDGVADTADGFLSARPRERVLEIMRDSRIGTMGVVAIFIIAGFKWAALAGMTPDHGWRAIVIASVAARSAMVITMGLVPYARKQGGLVSIFLAHRKPLHMVIALVSALVLAAAMAGLAGILAVLITAATALAFIGWCVKKIGGITGDTLGALTEISETIVLMVLCVGLQGGV